MDDKTKPTHLEVMAYIRNNYYDDTKELVERIITVMTPENIYDILNQYAEVELFENKRFIIVKFLLSKVNELKELYFGKEQ